MPPEENTNHPLVPPSWLPPQQRRSATPPPLTLEDIAKRYGGWSLRRSGTGRYWATLPTTPAQHMAGCNGMIDADTVEELDDKLWAETQLRRQVDQPAEHYYSEDRFRTGDAP